MTVRRYELVVAPTAKRQLALQLPESVALAAYQFIIGRLLDNPHDVGKQLRGRWGQRYSARRGTYRVLYRIDNEQRRVSVGWRVQPHRPVPRNDRCARGRLFRSPTRHVAQPQCTPLATPAASS